MDRTQDTWERVPLVELRRCWGLRPRTGWRRLSGNVCVFLSAATRAHVSAPVGVPREEAEACGSHHRLRRSAGQCRAGGGPRAVSSCLCTCGCISPQTLTCLPSLGSPQASRTLRWLRGPPGPLGGGVAVTRRPQARVSIARLSLHVAPFFLEFLPR